LKSPPLFVILSLLRNEAFCAIVTKTISKSFLNFSKESVMNKLMGVVLVSAGLMVAGCGNQQSQNTPAPEATASSAAVKVQETVATPQAKSLQDQVKDVAVQAENSPAVAEAKQNLQDTANALKAKAQTLLAEAKKYVDQGKFDEAIATAQNVLSFDPNNVEAQKIIENAKAKIKALVEQKAGELKTGLMDTMNSVGK
jgi:tetratricopeptide (TPR) repeat protein